MTLMEAIGSIFAVFLVGSNPNLDNQKIDAQWKEISDKPQYEAKWSQERYYQRYNLNYVLTNANK